MYRHNLFPQAGQYSLQQSQIQPIYKDDMKSRETDLINLLLCGSVLQTRRRSGLEGITSLMGMNQPQKLSQSQIHQPILQPPYQRSSSQLQWQNSNNENQLLMRIAQQNEVIESLTKTIEKSKELQPHRSRQNYVRRRRSQDNHLEYSDPVLYNRRHNKPHYVYPAYY